MVLLSRYSTTLTIEIHTVQALGRRTDWAERLHAFIAAKKDTPFEWGSQDCCLFACDCVLEMTGVDLAAPFRGMYSDEEGARAILTEGFMIFVGDIARAHSLPLIDPQMARRGDVVLCDQTGHGFETLGIAMDGVVIAPGVIGLRRIALTKAIAAWRI